MQTDIFVSPLNSTMKWGIIMFKDELLLKNNPMKIKTKIKMLPNKVYVYTNRSANFSFFEISQILNFLQNVKNRHKLSLLPIIIDLGCIKFLDKLSYVLLECICYNLIVKENCKLRIFYKGRETIYTAGIDMSCMMFLNENRDEFLKKFSFEIYRKHFRRIVKCENLTGEEICYITQDIETFLKTWGIDDECSDYISVVMGELIDNAIEHSKTDCLIDIDITEEPWVAPDGSEVYGVNIVVLNFADVLIYNNLMRKLNSLADSDVELPPRYRNAMDARSFHSNKWNENYNEEDFFTITAFQDKISGRENSNNTGGRGLTQLIEALETRSDDSHCYVLSGNKAIRFMKEYLSQNDEQWVGFNKSRDYLTDIPDEICIHKCTFHMPGTAYNLNFVLKKEENNNEQT